MEGLSSFGKGHILVKLTLSDGTWEGLLIKKSINKKKMHIFDTILVPFLVLQLLVKFIKGINIIFFRFLWLLNPCSLMKTIMLEWKEEK